MESKAAGLKQEIINLIKSMIRGVSAQAATSEEKKMNVILSNLKDGDLNLKDYDKTRNHFWAYVATLWMLKLKMKNYTKLQDSVYAMYISFHVCKYDVISCVS